MSQTTTEDKDITKELPYAVIGHTTLSPTFSLFLTGKGLKAIVEKLRPEEDVRITVGIRENGFGLLKIEVVDTHCTYTKRKES